MDKTTQEKTTLAKVKFQGPDTPGSAPGKPGTSPTPKADRTKDLKDYPFLCKTLITYTKLNPQGKEVKHKDEVVFKLDTPSAGKPWYVLRNYTVPKYLTSKLGPFEVGWQRIYEIKILKLVNRKNPQDIENIPMRVMTLDQLNIFNIRWELGVDVHEFYSVEKAREMVALRQEDEKGYEKHLADYRDGKKRTYPELDTMRGDIEPAIGTMEEFDELNKDVPMPTVKKAPAVVVEEETATDPVVSDPFAGV